MSDRTVAVCSAAALYSASESMYVFRSDSDLCFSHSRGEHTSNALASAWTASLNKPVAPPTQLKSPGQQSTPSPPVTLEQLTSRAVPYMPASSELIMLIRTDATSLHASSLTSSHVVSTSASTAHTGRPSVTLAPSLDKHKTAFNAFSFVHTLFQ
ncbi:hypothetical protein F5148DRAFT_216418 [Russula earlei]|uniref:Uncharacterized protein n=1 Tax=Russula earlei TaxID=71964 RepID=A0ACC0U6P0_9AGAM|nr:hypothetical protein F5148DRAFT_216418 [Russula earlei]